MTTQHTPGPWAHNGLDNHYPRDDFSLAVAVYSANETKFICSTDTPKHLARMAIDATEADANARLIAAAPDLLAALREYVERHEAEGASPGLPEYDQACAALAKAEGR